MGNLMSGFSTYNQKLYKNIYRHDSFVNSDDIGQLFKNYQQNSENDYVDQVKLKELYLKNNGNTRNVDKIIEFIFKSSYLWWSL
jgi:hypothetical protein